MEGQPIEETTFAGDEESMFFRNLAKEYLDGGDADLKTRLTMMTPSVVKTIHLNEIEERLNDEKKHNTLLQR